MRIINQQTKSEFDNIAAISFKMDGVNITGVIEVQGNQIPTEGVYLMPDLNGVIIHLRNTQSSINKWVEFDVVTSAIMPIQQKVREKWHETAGYFGAVLLGFLMCFLVVYCQNHTREERAIEIQKKEREDALREVNNLEKDL
jgi:hypothetical protein